MPFCHNPVTASSRCLSSPASIVWIEHDFEKNRYWFLVNVVADDRGADEKWNRGRKGKLVGIVSERNLLHAAPSSATSLSIWEVQYLLTKIQIKEIMTKDVVTTAPDTPLEDAARLMVTRKIGGLPVVDEHDGVVGIITETDIFETFVEMFAGGQAELRLTLEVPERKDVLSMLSSAIFELGGSIVLALSTVR
jgi:acetoin utilization protein AcuB